VGNERIVSSVLRQRLPIALLVTACAAAVTVAVTAAASPEGGIRFAQGGHWVTTPALDLVFHVNGASGRVDARAHVPGMAQDSQVMQGETSGYVVGSSRITEFGKSTLAVEHSYTPPSGEAPAWVETAGGPYLVYRGAGTIIRLGEAATPIQGGGKLGDPVATPDGTLWLHRTDSGALCLLTKGSASVDCPISVPAGHTGALTTVGERPVFVDTSEDVLRTVSADGLGEPKPIGADLPANARIAPADAAGRVAVLDKDNRKLLLVGDPPPVPVELPAGDYSDPTASGSSVVLLDRTRGNVLTYDNKGAPQRTVSVPKENGEPRLTRREDKRVYVDGGEGRNVLVVDHGGQITQVPVLGTPRPPETGAPQPPVVAAPPQTQAPAVPPPAATGRTPRPPAPQRTQPPPPRAVPASPPGLPPGVTATVQGANVIIRWGAAAANGATVNAYHVSWSPATSAGSNATHPGGTRSMTLSGLQPGTPYAVTVVAQNSAGRSAPATTQALVPVQRTPTVTVSRGRTTNYNDTCRSPECGKMKVVMRGFEPNKRYHVVPDSTDEYSNPGGHYTTDRNGYVEFQAFDFGEVGALVWVVVDGKYTSNRFRWVSG
jgi:hypothetical protein